MTNDDETKTVFYYANATAEVHLRILLALIAPAVVESPAILQSLNDARAQFRDKSYQMYGISDSLGVMSSTCASCLGETQLAITYAASELAENLNPVKQVRAYTAMGRFLL